MNQTFTSSYPSAFYLQFSDRNGKPYSSGYLKTYLASDHSMPVQTYTYPNSGVLNPTVIRLDDSGRCTMALDFDKAYYIELYDTNNSLVKTWDNVTAIGAEGSIEPGRGVSTESITSSDGTVTVVATPNGVDLSIPSTLFSPDYGAFRITGTDTGSSPLLCTLNKTSGTLDLNSNYIVLQPNKVYHVDIELKGTRANGYNYPELMKRVINVYTNSQSEQPAHTYGTDIDLSQNTFDMTQSFIIETSTASRVLGIGYNLSYETIDHTEVTEAVGTVSGYIHIYDAMNVNVGRGTDIEVDDELSTESENPVQNKVITAALSSIQASIPELEELDDNDVQTIWNNA